MKKAITRLKSCAVYQQGRYHNTPKETKEAADDYERRTWRERGHWHDETGQMLIPQMAFKNCLAAAARYLSVRIPGKNRQTYTKHFLSGVLVPDPVILPVTRDTVKATELFVSVSKGSGTRVTRIFPTVPSWEADVTWLILDDTVTEDVFTDHLSQAGSFIGIGVHRPENGGINGRFTLESARFEKL